MAQSNAIDLGGINLSVQSIQAGVSAPNGSASGPILSSAITALTATGTASLDPTKGTIFSVTPTGTLAINAASLQPGGEIVIVVTTSGASSYTITFGTNFKSTGTLATGTSSGKVFTICFACDGVNWNETGRTTAM